MNNPFYQQVDCYEEYKERCEVQDPEGYDFIFGDEPYEESFNNGLKPCSVLFIGDTNESWEEIMELRDYLIKLSNEIEESEEILYKTTDPIRKFQIDYDSAVCLSEKFPEAFHKENTDISVAPGEGKVPENILVSDNWDALAFPLKHPDGKYNLHYKRKVRLTDQYYFVQRLRNKDPRFRNDSSYLFAASGYLEKKKLQRNINVSFLRGKKDVAPSGENVYSLENAFSVFDSAANTPTYWKKAKYEMMAKLDNLGPFQFFFTLSCADKLWNENLTTILQEQGIKVHYGYDEFGEEETMVQVEKEGKMVWLTLDEYVEHFMDESIHEVLRRNVVTATRNYNHIVKSFVKEVMMDHSNPMSLEYYTSKLELQGRGAAHNHGTLWLNMEKVEYMLSLIHI